MAATEVTLKGSSKQVTIRNPRTVGLLDFFTLGIYGCYWYGQVNRDLCRLGRARDTEELGTNPRNSFLAVVPGYLLIVPAAISFWNYAGRLQTAQRMAGVPEDEVVDRLTTALLTGIVPPIGGWYTQKRLNEVFQREADTGADETTASSNGTGRPQREVTASPS